MPYREKKYYTGSENYLDIDIFPITLQEKKQPRRKKLKESLPKQKNLNDKNAKKHFTRLINNNFTDEDLSITLTYDEKNLPGSEEEARREVTNYIRRVKHYRKKNGLPDLKYIAVVEYQEREDNKKPIRIHHHLIMSGMDRDVIEQLWKKGRANADRLKADEYGYEGLARYITKDPKGSKRWTQSKNVKYPIPHINDCKYNRREVKQLANCQGDKEVFEKLYPGYLLNSCETQVNDINGGYYLYIKMRKLKI